MADRIVIEIYRYKKSWYLYGALRNNKHKHNFCTATRTQPVTIQPGELGKLFLDVLEQVPGKSVSAKASEKNIAGFLKTVGTDDWDKLYSLSYCVTTEVDAKNLVFVPSEPTSYGPVKSRSGKGGWKGQIKIPRKQPPDKIGSAILECFAIVESWDKRIAKNKNTGTKAVGDISAKVLREVKRLGGKFKKEKPQQKVINNFAVPEPIRQFLFDITWPKGAIYENSDGDTFWVWSLELGYFDTNAREEQPFLRKYTDAAFFGSSDGGNDSMLLFMNSKNPADPLVYRLEHDDFEERDWEKEENFIPLSKFLRSLRRKKSKT